MVSFSRTLRIDAPQADAWANLTDLESFARVMPILSNVTVAPDQLLSRFESRVGLWSLSGSVRMRVTERVPPARLRVQGSVALDEDPRPAHEPVRFDVVWFLEPGEMDASQVTYVLRLRATPTLERLASMTLSRRARSLDRRVIDALSKASAGRRAA